MLVSNAAVSDGLDRSSAIGKNAKLEVYKDAPHGLCSTEEERLNADLLAFIKSWQPGE